jgi:hypothetical protein
MPEALNLADEAVCFSGLPLLPIFTFSLPSLYLLGSVDDEVLVHGWCGVGAVLIGMIQVSYQW